MDAPLTFVTAFQYNVRERNKGGIMPRGGKRENAGRKPTGRTTRVVRIPSEIDINELLDLKDKLEAWQNEAKDKTGPRWEKVQALLKECLG